VEVVSFGKQLHTLARCFSLIQLLKESEMPNPGDKMYDCFNGELETVIFLEEGLAGPGCSVTTYLMRKTNYPQDDVHRGLFRCDKAMYKTTAQEALEGYLKEAESYLIDLDRQIEELKQEKIKVGEVILRNRALLLQVNDTD
jgi:hypothetical protein